MSTPDDFCLGLGSVLVYSIRYWHKTLCLPLNRFFVKVKSLTFLMSFIYRYTPVTCVDTHVVYMSSYVVICYVCITWYVLCSVYTIYIYLCLNIMYVHNAALLLYKQTVRHQDKERSRTTHVKFAKTHLYNFFTNCSVVV